jgi:dephospho-CoA kinase
MPYVVGLTGGIGSGKSKAAELFAELGADVVDTDAISHELTAPGGGAMSAIEEAFGASYLRPDGSLDRSRMRSLVFSDPAAKARLEGVLHPLIRSESRRRIDASRAPYVVLVVPLLLETGGYRDLLSRVLVVDCDESQQIARVVARSRLREDEIQRIMRAQLPRAERLRQADDVLANDADIETLRSKVRTLHDGYLASAVTAAKPQ